MWPLEACRETWLLYWNAGCSLDSTGSWKRADKIGEAGQAPVPWGHVLPARSSGLGAPPRLPTAAARWYLLSGFWKGNLRLNVCGPRDPKRRTYSVNTPPGAHSLSAYCKAPGALQTFADLNLLVTGCDSHFSGKKLTFS